MKRKIFSIFLTLVLALTLGLVTAVPVAAAGVNWYVDASVATTGSGTWEAPFLTIQEGVNAADIAGGDTVIVAEGFYDEQVVIDKSLTLQGVGDTTVIQPSSAATLTTVKTTPWLGTSTKPMAAVVFVDAAGETVTVKDLKIDGSSIATLPLGIVYDDWVTGLAYLETSGTIDNVAVQGDPQLGTRSCGIWASAISSTSTVEVKYCNVVGYNRGSIYPCGETLTVDFNHNEIYGPGEIVAQVPNGMFFLRGATGSATYNTVTDLVYTGEPEIYRSAGIATYAAGTDIVFSHNEISNVQNALVTSIGTSGTIIEYNTVYNCHTGVRIGDDAANSIIRYNDIHDNDFAIRCDPDMGDGNVAHYNNFVNHPGPEETIDYATYEGAVCNLSETYILDATLNWWGDPSGPSGVGTGTGDSVSENVLFDPWLTAPIPESGSVGMIAAYIPQIGISVTPLAVDFGAVAPGVASATHTVTVENTGNVAEDFSTTIENESHTGVYADGLAFTWILGTPVGVAVLESVDVSLVLTVPGGTAPGTYTATLVFWAEMAD